MSHSTEIHHDPDNWLAAAVHGQLSAEERAEFEQHLAGCGECRALYQQEIALHKMITQSLDPARPDLAFEQRVVSGFRHVAPVRTSFASGLAVLWRSRATQFVAAAAVLLSLVQMGRLITHEPAPLPSHRTAGTEEKSPEETYAGPQPAAAAGQKERVIVTGSYIPEQEREELASAMAADVAENGRRAAKAAAPPSPIAPREQRVQNVARDSADGEKPSNAGLPPDEPASVIAPDAGRKLIRNARVDLEVLKFDDAVQRIAALATEGRGYVATSSSQKLANGKLRGEVVVKVLPETLDGFLGRLRELGEVKNQTLGTDDVTKQYLDTDSRMQNARTMEQRLLEILKTKTSKVADLLEVEKELGRVRASIEQMQGELKYLDALVAFATVTITLTEKNMDLPAAFLLKRRAQLALFSTDVEKTFAEAKGVIDGAKAQISSSSLDRDSAGEATARLVLLIAPDEADAVIARIKGMGRVQNYNEQTDRIAQGGSGMAESAKVERDKVELSVVISRNEEEPALQTTSLRILTGEVAQRVQQLKESAGKFGAEIRNSSFNRQPNGEEYADVALRLPMKDYPALMSSLDGLGKVKDVSVHRDDRRGTIDEATAPADIQIRIYSRADIVSDESGLFATVRRTLMQGFGALMWSLRMIGVALAFVAPWVLVLAVVIWVVRRVRKARAK